MKTGSIGTAAAMTVAMLAGGCSLGPQYQRPDVAVPAAWHDDAVDPSAAATPSDWWRTFGSEELDAYIAEAGRTNADLAAALARVREADALARVAGAPLLPTVDATAGAYDERVQATNSSYANFHQGSVGLGASYMIDFWGRNRAVREAAVAAATASRRDQAVVRITVTTGVATTYFQALELKERIDVAQGNLRAASSILDGLRRQQAAGMVTALDVAQQETTVATLSAAVPPLQQQWRQSIDALAVLVGRNPETLQDTTTTLGTLTVPTIAAGLPSDLVARRPDIAEAESMLVAAHANVKAARAAFFPSIQLTASGGFASTELSSLLLPGSRVFLLGAGLTQPIFDGGALAGQSDYARARYDELVAAYRKSIVAAFANVEDALVAVRHGAERVERQQVAVERARRAHDFAIAQLRSGTVNVLAVLNTEAALFTAQDALVQARFARFQALVALYGALGGGWQAATT
ncbi:MAG TPA: efflux transporter outer membrane subunit [Burkholderiaceae bacterium]|nr:efflux transporter outer membrane subunit [Burkholderiaceae bacterium]